MSTGFLISHPEVVVDPAQPVTEWRLSALGVSRMTAFSGKSRLDLVTAVWSSAEAKAVEAAAILSDRLGVVRNVDPRLGENDRTATGFLPPAEFERTADEFFRHPEASVRGWERAVDAQKRVMAAVNDIGAEHGDGDLALVSHGGVGTLLLCSYLGLPISRAHDQPFQGHFWSFDLASRRVLHSWRALTDDQR